MLRRGIKWGHSSFSVALGALKTCMPHISSLYSSSFSYTIQSVFERLRVPVVSRVFRVPVLYDQHHAGLLLASQLSRRIPNSRQEVTVSTASNPTLSIILRDDVFSSRTCVTTEEIPSHFR